VWKSGHSCFCVSGCRERGTWVRIHLVCAERRAPGRFEENADLLYEDEAAEGDFVVVDTSKMYKRANPRWKRSNARNTGLRTDEDPTPVVRLSRNMQKAVNNSNHNKRFSRLHRARMSSRRAPSGGPVWFDPSVEVRSEWMFVDEYETSKLSELSAIVPAAQDLVLTGELRAYDARIDRAAEATRIPLRYNPSVVHTFPTVFQDQTMRSLVSSGAGTVYATDTAVALLMLANRVRKPWDLVFSVYAGGTMVIDVRDPLSQFDLELETVHETAYHPPEAWDPEDIDQQERLSHEATTASAAFRDLGLVEPSIPALAAAAVSSDAAAGSADVSTIHPDPLAKAHPSIRFAPQVHRYRRFDLGADQLVVRTTVHGLESRRSSPDRTLLISTFLERLTRVEQEGKAPKYNQSEWRRVFRDRPGEILATELQSNSGKVGRIVASAFLAGCDSIKLGFVTRANPADPTSHELVGVDTRDPESLAKQMSLDQRNMWGIVKWAISAVRAQVDEIVESGGSTDEDYKFLLMLAPESDFSTKSSLRFYQVGGDEFEPSQPAKGDDVDADEEDE
jgi:translation initiation factor 3 subunit D